MLTAVQFTAATVLSYLGLFAGFFLASITREELRTAQKYLPLVQRLIIMAAAVILADFFSLGLPVRVALYVAVFIAILRNLRIGILYGMLGALLFFVSEDANMLLILSSLVFLFGLVSGTMHYARNVKKKAMFASEARHLLVGNLFYPAVALALFAAEVSI